MLEASALKSLSIRNNFIYEGYNQCRPDAFLTFSDHEILPPIESLTTYYLEIDTASSLANHLQWCFLKELTLKLASIQGLQAFLNGMCKMPLSLRSLSLQEIEGCRYRRDLNASFVAFFHHFKGLRTLDSKTRMELGAPGMVNAIGNHGSTLQVLKVVRNFGMPMFPVKIGHCMELRDRCPRIQELELGLRWAQIFRDPVSNTTPSYLHLRIAYIHPETAWFS